MRQRFHAGRLSKVQRGEDVQRRPTGLVRLSEKRVITDPDQQMQQVIGLVFSTFAECGSALQVLRDCKQQEILLPRRHGNGVGPDQVRWRPPAAEAMCAILPTPASAGAFVHGRRTSAPRRHSPGRRPPMMVRRPMAEWQCRIQEASPASSSWTQSLANRARLRNNVTRFREATRGGRGAPRDGAAFLQGLATCGLCGRQMPVASRRPPRSVCTGLRRSCAAPRCAHLDGPSIDACVVHACFDAMAPAQLETFDEVLAQRQRERQRLEISQQQQVRHARFAATRARRRYEHGEPAYRLAAAARAREWDDRLRALRQAEEAAERCAHAPDEPTVPPALRHHLLPLSPCLPDLWGSPQRSHSQRQALLRRLISRGLVKRTAADRVAVQSIWASGHFSAGVVLPPVGSPRHVTGYDTMVERTRQLWAAGYSDRHIADGLSREGCRSAQREMVVAKTVMQMRHRQQWGSPSQQHRFVDKMDAQWTSRGLARELGVEWGGVSKRLRNGLLSEPEVSRLPPQGNELMRESAELLTRLRGEVKRSRRLRRNTSTPSLSPNPGGPRAFGCGGIGRYALCQDIENKMALCRVHLQTYKGAIMNHAQEQRRNQAVVRYLAGEKSAAICHDLHCAKSSLYKWQAPYQADDLEWAQGLSTQPRHTPSQVPQRIAQRVLALRQTLVQSGKHGSAASIQQELEQQGITPIPSLRTLSHMLQRHDQEDISLTPGLASVPDFVVVLNGLRGHIMRQYRQHNLNPQRALS
jgi:hypothetical protein